MLNELGAGLLFVGIGAVVGGGIALALGARSPELAAAIGAAGGLALALYARRLERARATADRR